MTGRIISYQAWKFPQLLLVAGKQSSPLLTLLSNKIPSSLKSSGTYEALKNKHIITYHISSENSKNKTSLSLFFSPFSGSFSMFCFYSSFSFWSLGECMHVDFEMNFMLLLLWHVRWFSGKCWFRDVLFRSSDLSFSASFSLLCSRSVGKWSLVLRSVGIWWVHVADSNIVGDNKQGFDYDDDYDAIW